MQTKKRISHLAGSCALGASLVLLLSGCGGTSFQTKTFGPFTAAGPAAYGLAGSAANPVVTAQTGGPFFVEVSGLSSPDGTTAYLSEATDFTIITGAGPLSDVDPNKTGKVPLGFSTGGRFIDNFTGSATPAVPQAVHPGTSVVFRVSISNGISAAGKVIPIKPDGVSLTSTDPQWTLGTLPMTFNFTNAGPFANATYVTGTPVTTGNGTPVPFTLPFTTTGLHTLSVTVTDANGQQTTTTYSVVVVTPTDVAVFAQNITPDTPSGSTAMPIDAGSTATITNPVAGATAQSTADAQGSVVLFTTPGTQTLTATSGGTVITQTLDLTAAAGTAVLQ